MDYGSGAAEQGYECSAAFVFTAAPSGSVTPVKSRRAERH